MRRAMLLLILVLAPVSLLSFAQSERKPYAGQETRAVKALSTDEMKAYLTGQGMGLAKVAELNSYPGPKHVIELTDQLPLSKQQQVATQRAFDEMHREAVALGHKVVDKEKELDELFASNRIDAGKLGRVSRDIALLQGSLRATHLLAHLKMKRILSPEQVKRYDELRGYNLKPGTGAHGEHHNNKEH